MCSVFPVQWVAWELLNLACPWAAVAGGLATQPLLPAALRSRSDQEPEFSLSFFTLRVLEQSLKNH